MSHDELRSVLLERIHDESLVDEFLEHIDSANEAAMTRIARANTTVESTDETPTDETVETEDETGAVEEDVVEESEVEEETEVVEDEVEEVEDVVEVNDVEIVLDEAFVHDLVGSPEFAEALGRAVEGLLGGLRAEFEARFRTLETEQAEEREWKQDRPARTTKRASVSYRPRNIEAENGVAITETLAEKASASLDEIFG